MENDKEIINRVAQSPMIVLDLEDIYVQGERFAFDIAPNLYQGLMLKEKDFREFLKVHDWTQYLGKHVALFSSEDAIIPTWAFMLLAIHLQPVAASIVFGNLQNLEQQLFQQSISTLDLEQYRNAKLIIKGCSKVPVPEYAYVEITRLLTPIAQSLMFGEPCSTVPLMKRK